MKTFERKRYLAFMREEARKIIRDVRKDLGLSQTQLAKKMVSEVDQSTISNWENGRTDINFTQFMDILAISGRSLEDLAKKEKD